MRTRSLLPFVIVLAAVCAACSGGDESSTEAADATTVAPSTTAPAAPPTTTAPPTPAPATTAPPTTQPATSAPPTTAPVTTAPGDPLAALAVGALLTIDDFATGWSAQPPDDTADDDDEASAIVASCAGVDVLLIDDVVLGTSLVEASFSTDDDTFEVEQSAGFAADEATATAASAAVADPEVPGCYAEAVALFFEEAQASTDPADTLPPGMEIGQVTASSGDLAAFALQADDASWFHVAYPLSLAGQTFEQHADFVFLRNGAALSRVMLTGFGATFPLDDLRGIVELADARLATIA